MLTRLKYANIPEEKLIVIDKINNIIKKVKNESIGNIYTMVCFDMTEILRKKIMEESHGKNRKN